MHRCTVALLLSDVCRGLAFGRETDGIEFADLTAAAAGGWDVTDHTTLSATQESRIGRYGLLAQPQAGAKPYLGMNLHRELDLPCAGLDARPPRPGKTTREWSRWSGRRWVAASKTWLISAR